MFKKSKILFNNIKSNQNMGIFFMVGYFGFNIFINYKCFEYLKKSEFNLYNYCLMIL